MWEGEIFRAGCGRGESLELGVWGRGDLLELGVWGEGGGNAKRVGEGLVLGECLCFCARGREFPSM